MWLARPRSNRESTMAQARLFLACWDVLASTEGELRFRLRERTLTQQALNAVMERAVGCVDGAGTRVVFDLSGVDEMESCYSVICALFIRFACRIRKRYRITGLQPRLADVMGFFFRRAGCVEVERPAAAAAPVRMAS